jgi:hypothetical protein
MRLTRRVAILAVAQMQSPHIGRPFAAKVEAQSEWQCRANMRLDAPEVRSVTDSADRILPQMAS